MEANKMFEVAVRDKFRYPYKGVIATEDLWDLSVQQLDGIFKTLKSQEKKAQEESLLDTRTPAEHAKELSDQKQKILNILAEKQDEDLRNKTPEELKAMLEQLG